MAMEIEPLYNLVIVERVEEAAEKIGSIYVPDKAKERPQEGTVIAVGPGRLLPDGSLRPLSVAPGDRVLFGKYSGSEIKLNGVARLLLREDDIIAKFVNKENSNASE